MSKEPIVDQCCLIAVAPFWMTGPCDRILDHGDLEALFEELAQMGLDTHVRQHPAEDDLRDPPLTQLQDQVVGLRAEYFVRADDDRLAVFDVWLESIEPIGTGILEPRQIEGTASRKCAGFEFIGLERPVDLPSIVGRVEVVGGDENKITMVLGGFENPLHILDGLVLRDALAHSSPILALLA